jgi:hypothetical protein
MLTEECRDFPRHDTNTILKSSRGETNSKKEEESEVTDKNPFSADGIIVNDRP